VFNKIDIYQPIEPLNESEEDLTSLDSLKKSWMARMNNKTRCVFISAENKDNIEELKQVVYKEVKEIFKIRYPYNNFLY
jgi:GTP-binding protein HflX